jgi:hypothetical protein
VVHFRKEVASWKRVLATRREFLTAEFRQCVRIGGKSDSDLRISFRSYFGLCELIYESQSEIFTK